MIDTDIHLYLNTQKHIFRLKGQVEESAEFMCRLLQKCVRHLLPQGWKGAQMPSNL